MLAQLVDGDLAHAPTIAVLTPQQASEPLLVRIDQWGYTPWTPEPLTAQSISSITRAHLTGRPTAHRSRRAALATADQSHDAPVQPDLGTGVVLDGTYYDHGVRARHIAHAYLAGIDDQFDEINDRTDDLLRRLTDIIGYAD